MIINVKPSSTSTSIDDTENERNSAYENENAYCNKFRVLFVTISSQMMDRANGFNSQLISRRDERFLDSATSSTIIQQYSRRTGYHKQCSFGRGQNSSYTPVSTCELAG
ncbi:LSM14 proteinA [Schistosoma japonicum]|uniref:LSM14 proteinA n=1 Tax=Schistosoma japonicum TaxID=6182 RepID=A0A4Z2DEB9_SCHJA|nr:LSM14 proteinA [Schistosoma japonicum]